MPLAPTPLGPLCVWTDIGPAPQAGRDQTGGRVAVAERSARRLVLRITRKRPLLPARCLPPGLRAGFVAQGAAKVPG